MDASLSIQKLKEAGTPRPVIKIVLVESFRSNLLKTKLNQRTVETSIWHQISTDLD